MELAVLVVKEDRKTSLRKRIGVREILRKLKVPRATLNNRVTGKVSGFYHKSGGNNKIFTDIQEKELMSTVSKHSEAGFPFPPIQVRQVAHEFAVLLNKRKTNFDDERQEQLSHKWYSGFVKRHKKDVSHRTPQALSVHRVSCANRETVKKWFDWMKIFLREKNITSPVYIWNIDETGLQDIPKVRKVLCPRRKKANQIIGKEKGTTTCVAMVNAAGMKVPPMIIHKGNTVTAAWLTNCPDDVLVRAQESGYINTDLFLEMGYHFLEFLKKNQLDTLRHLILLDGHVTHTYNSYFINLMKANNVLVIVFPLTVLHFYSH